MSEMHSDEAVRESRSSVKIGTTAKGTPTVEVKVYADRDDFDAAEAAAAKAYELFESLCGKLGL